MALIEDQRFVGVRVEMDGNAFAGCRFIGCELIFRGRQPFSLVHCGIGEGCSWRFEDQARMMLYIIGSLLRDPADRLAIVDAIEALIVDRPTAH